MAVTDGVAFVVSGVVATGFLDVSGAPPDGDSGATVAVSAGAVDVGGVDAGNVDVADEVVGATVLDVPDDGASVLLSPLQAARIAAAAATAAIVAALVTRGVVRSVYTGISPS